MTCRWNPARMAAAMVAISAISAACQSDMTAPSKAQTAMAIKASTHNGPVIRNGASCACSAAPAPCP